MTADTQGSFPFKERINHAPLNPEQAFPDECHLPHVSQFEWIDRHKAYFWEVSLHNGLVLGACARSRKRAVKECRKALNRAYIEFCEELARLERLEFNE